MTIWGRFVRFNLVGALGVGVQLATLWLLTSRIGVHYMPATVIAVGTAVLHNFLWHRRWTWADRCDGWAGHWGTLMAFVTANGAVSLAGNLVLMVAFVDGLGLPPAPANLLAIGATAVLNFWLGDRVVFAPQSIPRTRP